MISAHLAKRIQFDSVWNQKISRLVDDLRFAQRHADRGALFRAVRF